MEEAQTHLDVTSKIVVNGVCSGCGVCAGVCPTRVLQMKWGTDGDRTPVKVGPCPTKCDLCLRVCPFNDECCSEDMLAERRFADIHEIQHSKIIGYYLKTYVAYSKIASHRSQGSSGGMVTWMLETLLTTGQVDGVVCVGRGQSRDSLFTYQILNQLPEVRAAAGSRYYPVDMANVVRELQSLPAGGRYAVVGLPCSLKSMSLAMLALPVLRQSVFVLLGLVCGHLPNRHYTEYLARLSGVTPAQLGTVDYRLKTGTRAGIYYFQARAHDGTAGRLIPFSGHVSHAWREGFFQYNACNYCDDVFAELADAVFMDAWLPEYETDPGGHSLVVVRHPQLKQILARGCAENTCCLEQIPVDKVVASQEASVYWKTVKIAGRLYHAQQRGQWIPNRRVSSSAATFRTHRHEIEARYAVQSASRKSWPELREAPLWCFHLKMLRAAWPLRTRLWWWRFRSNVANPRLLLRLITLLLRQQLYRNRQEHALMNSREDAE